MRRILGPGIVLLLACAGVIPHAVSQPVAVEGAAPWWPDDRGVDRFREGWNLRIPLSITETRGLPEGSPVQVHLDLAQSLIEGGWPTTAGGPASFLSYPESIRLVEYGNGWQTIEGEVPFVLHTAWLDPDQIERYGREQVGAFHGQRNPVVTLEWRLPRDLPAGGTHYYYVYFDIHQNAGADQQFLKEPPSFDPEAEERLDGLYWIGAGVTIYGSYRQATPQNTLLIIATQGTQADPTNVQVYAARGPGAINRLDQREPDPHPEFSLMAGQARGYSLGFADAHFRVEADKPVVVMSHGPPGSSGAVKNPNPEFVPSREGGLLGWTFDVPDAALGVYVIKPPGSLRTDVSITGSVSSSCGSSNQIVLLGEDSVDYCRITFTNRGSVSNLRTIQVQSGDDPILVQFIPDTPSAQRAQASSALGSPVGTTFHASTISEQDCPQSPTPAGGLQVTAWGGPAFVDVEDRTVDPASQVHHGREVQEAMPTRLGGSQLRPWNCPGARDTQPYTVEAVTDPNGDPTGPLQLRVGTFGNGEVTQTTPYGGRHGVEFVIEGPFVVYNFYPTTRLNLAGAVEDERTAGPPHLSIEYPQGKQDVTVLSADKPVAVFPLGLPDDFARFHAAKPDFVVPTIHPGEYRGYLFGLHPQDGDPTFVTAQDGDSIDASFQVRNLARWNGEPLEDSVRFSTDVTSSNWDGATTVGVGFDHEEMALPDHGVRNNKVRVDLPPDIPSGTQLNIHVRAESVGNPQMIQDFSVVVLVRQTFGVDLWFGPPGSQEGAESERAAFVEGASRQFDFVVKNTGSGVDDFHIDLGLPPSGGWDAHITDSHGIPLEMLELGPGEQASAILHVQAPLTVEVSEQSIPVAVRSDTSPLASALITLRARIDLERDLQLDAEELMKEIAPGTTQRFNVTLHNTGEGGLTVQMQLDADLLEGWAIVFADTGGPDFETSMLPGDPPILVPIDITAPVDAAAGDLASFLVSAEGLQQGEDLRDAVSLAAVVSRTDHLEIRPVAAVDLLPGQVAEIHATVTNLGNSPEEVRIEPVATPGGWGVVGLNSSAIGPGNTSTLAFRLMAPEKEPPGPTTILMQARGGGRAFPFPVLVRVADVHQVTWEEVQDLRVQPGETREMVARLHNQGNVAERITLEATGAGVTVTPPAMIIPPHSLRPVRVEWTVPTDSAEGEDTLRITARSDSGSSKDLAIPLHVTAPRLEADQLVVTEPSLGPGSVGVLMAVLRNPGDVPVRDAEVRLVSSAGKEHVVMDKVRFESVGANGTVVAPLRWAEEPGTAPPDRIEWGYWMDTQFHVLGDAHMPEQAPSAAEQDRGIPTPLAMAAVAALLAAWAQHRRGAP